MSDKIATWRGRPIESLTREELIDALTVLAAQLSQERAAKQAELEMWRGLDARTLENWERVKAMRQRLAELGIWK